MAVRPQINLAAKHKEILKEEYSVSDQTIRMVLMYVNNSPKAKEIRKRAKELLEQEANNVVLDESGK
ncbi:hypothetical protein [Carboxylicivirga linearis]|uniref:DUF3606 domain-containing protein n=1 Tax=Carboxylicivirga linearis TaxID=1628157 RepID=A0ABS5K0N7_9BACT|nr:hypothetical protein [Carboxylicivirga linearis]MBS2100675.1 hypothetical protein [Carboxylicivirga linearis]